MTKENKKIKNLNLAEMKKQDKKLDAQKEEFITIGDDVYKVLIDEQFRNTKKNKVLDDLIKFFEAGYKDERLYTIATPYTSLLLIKHFTSLDIPDDIEEAMIFLELLIDLKILEKILTAMPEDQVVEMYETLTDTMNQISENMIKSNAEAKELLGMVENEEVKAWVEDNVKPISEK